MKTIAKIINIFGGVKNLYASIENPPYMRLVIEDIGTGPCGHQAISVAHYFTQNGDLCQDPEMCFELIAEGGHVAYEPFFVSTSDSADLPGSLRERPGFRESPAETPAHRICADVGPEPSGARLRDRRRATTNPYPGGEGVSLPSTPFSTSEKENLHV